MCLDALERAESCGACLSTCKSSSAMLFVADKVCQLSIKYY